MPEIVLIINGKVRIPVEQAMYNPPLLSQVELGYNVMHGRIVHFSKPNPDAKCDDCLGGDARFKVRELAGDWCKGQPYFWHWCGECDIGG